MQSILAKGALFAALSAALAAQSYVTQDLPRADAQPSRSETSAQIHLRYATFDPQRAEPAVPEFLRSGPGHRLWIVQFPGTPTQQDRDAVAATGAQIHGWLPHNAYVVRMSAATGAAVRALGNVRWVGAYHPAYRLDPALAAALPANSLPPVADYHLVVVDKRRDKAELGRQVLALGGRIAHEQPGSLLFTVTLTPAQLLQVAHLDQVLWIDAVTETGTDMDNARIQGGGNYVEQQGGYTGTGINAHIYEGIEAAHQDFTGGAVNVRSSGAAQTHGHATAGIVFGNGTSNPAVRGMAPDAGKFYTNYSTVSSGFSRWQIVQELVNVHNVSHTTASWGDATTTAYTSVSADADDIVFDHDITWTNSQSNTGNRNSRPQAWAKNVFSVGAVQHFDDSNAANDSWNAGGASIGPAADGRFKPDICFYYDSIGTSDRSGSAGYSAGNWTATFGGTSGATPIVAGHNVLLIDMFTDDRNTPGTGLFGNPLRVPNGTKHQNRPHFTMVKALQMACASQYAFTAASTDNRREHQGWGMPNLRTMYDNRNSMFLVDETDVLTQGNTTRWDVTVAPGTPQLKIVLAYNEPAGNPAASVQLVNNLSLRVTAPNNTVYWGNAGLNAGVWSTPGGSEDNVNPNEAVFVSTPAAGTWQVEVIATAIVADNHLETPAVDADYALAVVGATGQPSTSGFFVEYGSGCAGTNNVVTPCATLNAGGGTLTGATSNLEYLVVVPISPGIQLTSFDLFTRSTGGTVVRPAHLYTSLAGAAPIASTTMTIGPTAGFHRATFAAPVQLGSVCYIALDVSSGNVLVPNLTSGPTGVVFQRTPNVGAWQFAATVTRPAYRVDCTAGTQYFTPALDNVGSPVLGASYDVTLADALGSSIAFLLTGLSDSLHNGTPLPYALPNAPGCAILAAPQTTLLRFTSPTGAASASFALPNSPAYIGLEMFHQWAVLDAANALGIVVSNAGKARLGT